MHPCILNWNIAIVAVLTQSDFTNMAVMLSDLLRNLTFNRSAHCTQVSDQCPLGLLFLYIRKWESGTLQKWGKVYNVADLPWGRSAMKGGRSAMLQTFPLGGRSSMLQIFRGWSSMLQGRNGLQYNRGPSFRGPVRDAVRFPYTRHCKSCFCISSN